MVERVVVIGGGRGAEAEVSRSSAQQIVKALRSRYTVNYVELEAGLVSELDSFHPDVVFPVVHGPPGEDGTLQGFLDILEIPYVGSGVRASAVGIDKSLAKQQFRTAELPVLPDLVVNRRDERSAIHWIQDTLGDKIVCKPIRQGSALGVTLLPQGGDIGAALATAFEYDQIVLVEPFVKGREITVGVLDLEGQATTALPVIEIEVGKNQWYNYTNRYTPGRSRHIIPAEIESNTYKNLQAAAVGAHRALGCRELSRADFLLEESNRFWILEVNTMPGMTPTSLYPDASRIHGINFEQLASNFVESAYRRSLME